MRIKLDKGKQKELILLAKSKGNWEDLAKKLKLNQHYLSLELQNEYRLISENTYKLLCEISNKSFDKYIQEKLDDNWGQIKGAIKSKGSTINLKISNNKKALSEFIGILLGDGNIFSYKKGNKIGVYQVRVAGDYNKDKEYHLRYIRPLSESLFNLKAREYIRQKKGERYLFWSSKELVLFLESQNLKSGNKIRNQVTIPKWIREDKEILKYCIRGLIDTDGSIFRMSRKDPNLLRICFTNYNKKLMGDVRESFQELGFNPSKVIDNRNIFLSRKKDIEKYINEIGFSNQKHRNRLQEFRKLIAL